MKFLPIATTQTYHSTCRGSTPVTEMISMRIWFPFIRILVILRVQVLLLCLQGRFTFIYYAGSGQSIQKRYTVSFHINP